MGAHGQSSIISRKPLQANQNLKSPDVRKSPSPTAFPYVRVSTERSKHIKEDLKKAKQQETK